MRAICTFVPVSVLFSRTTHTIFQLLHIEYPSEIETHGIRTHQHGQSQCSTRRCSCRWAQSWFRHWRTGDTSCSLARLMLPLNTWKHETTSVQPGKTQTTDKRQRRSEKHQQVIYLSREHEQRRGTSILSNSATQAVNRILNLTIWRQRKQELNVCDRHNKRNARRGGGSGGGGGQTPLSTYAR